HTRSYGDWSSDVCSSDLLTFGSANITGLAAEGFFLYTMDTANVLRVIDTSGDVMVARGSVSLSAGGGKLFIGNGTAYVAAANYRSEERRVGKECRVRGRR